ncbi:MAG: hypothetical protein CMJ48_09055 [Planctomycetaceae bacterium]|nr:hypothetical protein [Planctomycetaceae bacterium]
MLRTIQLAAAFVAATLAGENGVRGDVITFAGSEMAIGPGDVQVEGSFTYDALSGGLARVAGR